MRKDKIKNNNDKYFILNFKDIEDKTLKEFKESYNKEEYKIILNELKLYQLITHPGIGVYIFYENNKVMYIGRNSSKCFIERIPAHFDIRKKGWFNQLLYYYCEYTYKKNRNEITVENLKNASDYIIEHYSLQLISFEVNYNNNKNFNNTKKDIQSLEKILIHYLESKLNSYKKGKNYDEDDKIINIIKSMA